MTKRIAKTELLKTVAAATRVNRQDVRTVIDTFIAQATDQLAQGGKVQLTDFGTFEIQERSARERVVPGLQQPALTPARKYTVFKASASLKDSVK